MGINKKTANKFLVAVAKVVIFFIGIFPRTWCLAAGRTIGRLAYGLMKSRRQVALDNLAMVYGHSLNLQQRENIARENFGHLGASILEVLNNVVVSERLKKFVRVEGLEYVAAALQQGKGVVFFSAHMGNFLIMVQGLQMYYKVKFIYREPSEPTAAAIYNWMIKRGELEVIADNPRHKCALRSIYQLRAKGSVGVLIDQVETGGLYVDFMGHPAGSTLGAGNLTLKTSAPLIPVHCVRLPDQTLKIIIEPEYVIPREGDYAENLKQAVTGMNKVVEQWVRKNPEQWFWGHRRWRAWRK